MQLDMHFYGTYALARAAGLPPDIAATVATSAQFVDDATDRVPATVSGDSFIVPSVSAHKMLEAENMDPADQWQVWVPFHFLPGGEGDSAEQRLLCRPGEPGNPATDRLVELAQARLGEAYGWHLLGVVTHVLQDTYSHWGFSGISSDYNRVEQGEIRLNLTDDSLRDEIMGAADKFWEGLAGNVAEDVSRLGHGAVATYPDRPYLNWEFDYEMSLARCPRQENATHVQRDNPAWFLMACARVYGLFAQAAQAQGLASPRAFSAIQAAVQGILNTEARMKERINAWKQAISGDVLFTHVPADTDLSYDEGCWATAGLHRKPLAVKQQAQLFYKASRTWRCCMLTEILPTLGLV